MKEFARLAWQAIGRLLSGQRVSIYNRQANKTAEWHLSLFLEATQLKTVCTETEVIRDDPASVEVDVVGAGIFRKNC